MDSVLVSWTPSDGAEFYTILYQQPDQMPDMVFVPDGRADSITIGISPTFSILGLPFSFTLIAHTALPSVAVGPVEFTLGKAVYSPFHYSANSLCVCFRSSGCQDLTFI